MGKVWSMQTPRFRARSLVKCSFRRLYTGMFVNLNRNWYNITIIYIVSRKIQTLMILAFRLRTYFGPLHRPPEPLPLTKALPLGLFGFSTLPFLPLPALFVFLCFSAPRPLR